MGFSIAVIWPTILADARRRIPQRSTTAFGILVAAGGLGAMSFPLVVGRLSEATGDWHKAMQAILIPMALMLLMFAALSAFDRVRGRRQ
jgi:fucose permease